MRSSPRRDSDMHDHEYELVSLIQYCSHKLMDAEGERNPDNILFWRRKVECLRSILFAGKK